MHSRWLRVAVAVGWFAWTALIIPGHTRGAIALCPDAAGCRAPHRAAEQCCAGRRLPSSHPDPAPARAPGNCAICFLAAYLTHSPAPSFDLSLRGTVLTAPPAHAADPDVPSAPAAHQIRGPPFVA